MKKVSIMLSAVVAISLTAGFSISSKAAPAPEVFDFTISVPVEVHDVVTEVDQLRVYCTVRADSNTIIGEAVSDGTNIPASRSYSSTLSVTFNAGDEVFDIEEGHAPGEAVFARCVVQLHNADNDQWSNVSPAAVIAPVWRRAREGEPFAPVSQVNF